MVDANDLNQIGKAVTLVSSGHQNKSIMKLSFSVTVPIQGNISLLMQAQWDIEQDYDYVQIRANGVALGNHQALDTPLARVKYPVVMILIDINGIILISQVEKRLIIHLGLLESIKLP